MQKPVTYWSLQNERKFNYLRYIIDPTKYFSSDCTYHQCVVQYLMFEFFHTQNLLKHIVQLFFGEYEFTIQRLLHTWRSFCILISYETRIKKNLFAWTMLYNIQQTINYNGRHGIYGAIYMFRTSGKRNRHENALLL